MYYRIEIPFQLFEIPVMSLVEYNIEFQYHQIFCFPEKNSGQLINIIHFIPNQFEKLMTENHKWKQIDKDSHSIVEYILFFLFPIHCFFHSCKFFYEQRFPFFTSINNQQIINEKAHRNKQKGPRNTNQKRKKEIMIEKYIYISKHKDIWF